MQFEVGSVVEGKVTGITNFGAFVELEGGVTGLVHISEVALEYVKEIKDHLKVGDAVKVKVLSIDKNKIALSIKQAIKPEAGERPRFSGDRASRGPRAPRRPAMPPGPQRGNPMDVDWHRSSDEGLSFEDKLNKFKQASDEKMHDLKKNVEGKRRNGGRHGGY